MENYYVKRVVSAHKITTEVPGSKSITNRALLLAAMANGTSVLKGVLFSDDSRHFIQALADLNFPVEVDETNRTVKITGYGGKIPCEEETKNGQRKVYVGSAGTAARFLTALLGLSKGKYYIDASEQMKKRPMKELLDALENLDAKITYEQEPFHFPFCIGNDGCKKDYVEVDIDKSSQFLSALLIVSVLFEHDMKICVKGTHGMDYVKMTIQMMQQFGVDVEQIEDYCYLIRGNSSYQAREYIIEPDLSAACYFYAMSPLLHVPVCVHHVHMNCLQGDVKFLGVLKDMGCKLEDDAYGVKVLPPEDRMRGGSWDLSSFSDQALTLAAIAPFASETVRIRNIGHIQYQECDRIFAICENLHNIGIRVERVENDIIIYPGNVNGATIQTFEDHRVAMSFSLVGLMTDNIVIENPMCCRKTFENYFDVLESVVY